MSEKDREDLFYVCSLIEHIGRKTKNRRSDVVRAMSDATIRHQLAYADINHSLPFDRISDELVAECQIGEGGYDTIKKFGCMTDEWLDFIADCRGGKGHAYDLVEGPMANDTIWNYVNDFVNGVISREAFWALAKFRYPTHQICFHTAESLKCLKFIKCEEIPRDEA